MDRAYVLLSGGIDSTTCLHMAHQEHREVHALSIDYGQRHFKEIKYAAQTCKALDIPHRVLDLSSIVPQTMLTDESAEIPNKSYDEIVGVSPTYVPFRNGLMLSALASYVAGKRAEFERDDKDRMLGEWYLYFGAHAEDAAGWAYPDCTAEFTGAMANAIYIGTYNKIRLRTPLQWMKKYDIIKAGEDLGVDWKSTWSCYAGGEKHCGVCPTCRARRQGFDIAEVLDPTDYASTEYAA